MQNIYTDELFSIAHYNYKIATLLLFVLIGYAIYTALYYCVKDWYPNKILELKTITWLPGRKFNGKMCSILFITLLLVILIFYKPEMKSTKQDYTTG